MKNWLESGAVTDLASINKKRRELEEYARIRIEKIHDQIMYSDITLSLSDGQVCKSNCSNHAAQLLLLSLAIPPYVND